MNFCENCGIFFTDSEAICETKTFETEYGVSDLFPTRTEFKEYHCPECGSTNIEEAMPCDNCGEHHPASMLIDTYESLGVGYLCEDCYGDAMMDARG